MGKASRRKAPARLKAMRDVLQARLDERGIGARLLVRSDLPDEQKISNALSKILASEVEGRISLEEYRHHANAIVLAWNLTLLPPEEQAATLTKLEAFAAAGSGGSGKDAVALVKRLMQKKLATFPDDRRYIVSHDVQFVGDSVHVTAAALSAPPQPGDAS